MSWHELPGRATVIMALAVSGCALAGHHSSPWEWGGGVRIAPGWALGTSGLTIHPMGSVTYLDWDGGHDLLWELGGQVRKPVSAQGLWIGGEAAISRLATYVDDFDYSASQNGWSLTGLVGYPVGHSKWGLNLYAGAGISDYGASGTNVRVGVDLQPWFLKR